MENHPHRHSFFWPILLVGVGVIWLLRNLGIIQAFNLAAIFKLWPLLLIILGIDIIFSRRYPWIGAIMGLVAVAGIVGLLIYSPNLGVTTTQTTKTESFSEPIENTASAIYYFDTASSPVEINALSTQDANLIQADITHRGTLRFDVSGSDQKTVRVSEDFDNTNWFYWDLSLDQLKWDVGISPDVPTEIKLNGGSGSIKMDLSNVQLTSLTTDFGSGASTIDLPAAEDAYQADIESGSGSVSINIPDKAALTMTLDTGSGATSIDLPSDAALRVEIMDEGSGSLSLPDGLVKSPDSSSFSIGAWQTEGYDKADHKIEIKILGQGSGSISIH